MHEQLPIRRQRTGLLVLVAFVLLHGVAAAQGLTGMLIGTVSDVQGAAIPGAVVHLGSPAMIGGPTTLTTDERGQLRFLSLTPGLYELDISMPGFEPFHETNIFIGAGATIEKTVVLELAGVAESVVVQGAGSGIDPRNPGFGTRFGPEDIETIPTRRASMFEWIRAAPGISPTSPSSGIATTISAFGSGTNENQFLIDGMNTTCPCSGVARTGDRDADDGDGDQSDVRSAGQLCGSASRDAGCEAASGPIVLTSSSATPAAWARSCSLGPSRFPDSGKGDAHA